MSKLTGYISPYGRTPMLVVSTSSGRKFSAVVDTGFGEELFMSRITAHAVGVIFTPYSLQRPVTLAGGGILHVRVGELEIVWTLGIKKVSVYVHNQPGSSEVLLGTELLNPSKLTVDFLSDLVTFDP